MVGGLTIAIAPGLGYMLAFVYQLGFAKEMHIPMELIQIELRDVLLTTVALFLIVPIAYNAIDQFASFNMPQHPGKRLALGFAILAVTLIGPPIMIYMGHLDKTLPIVIPTLLFSSLFLVPRCFFRARRMGTGIG